MKYTDLKLSINNEYNIVQFEGLQIKILQYLPIEDKIDLIEIALQRSEENGIYNEMKLDMYFHLYMVYMYTDLEFSEEEKQNEIKLYNELCSNRVIQTVIHAVDEYNELFDYLNIMKESNFKYKNSVSALLQTFIQDMPKNAEAAAKIVDSFDKEKYKEVIDFAKYANGDRSI